MVPHRPYLILLIWPLSLRESSTHYYLMHGGRVGGGGGRERRERCTARNHLIAVMIRESFASRMFHFGLALYSIEANMARAPLRLLHSPCSLPPHLPKMSLAGGPGANRDVPSSLREGPHHSHSFHLRGWGATDDLDGSTTSGVVCPCASDGEEGASLESNQ